MAIIIALFASFVTVFLLCCVLFKDWDDFTESLKFWNSPDIISALEGRWHEDQWAEARLKLCVVIGLFVGVCAYLKFS